jgi:hypothetical protein
MMGLTMLLAGPAAAQEPPGKTWTPPKTAWGHPDLQGAWTSDSARGIPMQRPKTMGTRAQLTNEEFTAKVTRDQQARQNALNASGAQTGGRDAQFLVKSFRQTSLIVDPPDGQTPAFTSEAEQRRAPRDRGSFGEGPFDDPNDFTLYDRCITRGIVGSVLPVPYGNGNRIIQTPDAVVITYEMIHDTRVIPLDGRPHLGSHLRQYLGDSRGHWEGNTLVVETTNFTDQTSIGPNGNGVRHSAAMRLIERLTRTAADVLQYDIRLEDPKTYVQPWTISLPLVAPPGFQPLPYECHEGNGAVKNILSAERAEDAAIAADARKGIIRPRHSIQQGLDSGARPRPANAEGGPE